MTSLGLDVTIGKVTDYGAIAGYGAMKTPALVVDEKALISSRVPTPTQIRELLVTAGS